MCPKKLEVIGDDRTLVIPRKAFRQDDDEFASLCSLAVSNDGQFSDWRTNFWKYFATFMGRPRVVRRGDIDPDSSIRESGHRLLWPHCSGQPDETGASSGECAIHMLQYLQLIDNLYVLIRRSWIAWVDYCYRTRHIAIL